MRCHPRDRREALPRRAVNDVERLYTLDELAESFQLPKSTLAELCKREGWPHHRLGRAIRFTGEQVEDILANHLVSPGPRREESPFPGYRGHRARSSDGRLPGQTERSAALNYRD